MNTLDQIGQGTEARTFVFSLWGYLSSLTLSVCETAMGFFDPWIPKTIRIFAPTGRSVYSREFWRSQMRFELDHRLWRPECLGREPTEDELDFFVEEAMQIYWPQIQGVLRELSSDKQQMEYMLARMTLDDEEEIQQVSGDMEGDGEDLVDEESPEVDRREKMKRYGDFRERLRALRAERRVLEGIMEEEAEDNVAITG